MEAAITVLKLAVLLILLINHLELLTHHIRTVLICKLVPGH